MDRERRVQVVLGETEPDEGILRFVLEGEGFDIVGQASSDEELERVLRGARPSVIVLDGGISAAAALEARERATGAALVVVWPEGVATVVADERVDPLLVVDDLGPAVRRASVRARTQEPIVVPEAIDEVIRDWRAAEAVLAPVSPTETDRDRPDPVRRGRSARGSLLAAATWILILTTLTTIAAAVPNAFELFADRGRRPSPSATARSRPSPSARVAPDRETAPAPPVEDGSPERRCGPGEDRPGRGNGSNDRGGPTSCRSDGSKGDGKGERGGGGPDAQGNSGNDERSDHADPGGPPEKVDKEKGEKGEKDDKAKKGEEADGADEDLIGDDEPGGAGETEKEDRGRSEKSD